MCTVVRLKLKLGLKHDVEFMTVYEPLLLAQKLKAVCDAASDVLKQTVCVICLVKPRKLKFIKTHCSKEKSITIVVTTSSVMNCPTCIIPPSSVSFTCPSVSPQFFRVDVLYESPDGVLSMAPASHIMRQLETVLSDAREPAQFPVGILTSEHRDTWTHMRERLASGAESFYRGLAQL